VSHINPIYVFTLYLEDIINIILIIRITKARMRWAGHVVRMEKAVVHSDLVGIPEGKRQLG
jgi:hypothetical protein